MSEWFEETLHDDMRQRLKMDRVLYDSKTEHQRIVLFENALLGRVLTLDGVVQTTEADEFVYHEMLTHLPILAHGKVRRVLVVGGGDGGMLEELLKHRGVERVTMVEIDRGVIDFSRQYLPEICKDAFDDPRLDLVIADGEPLLRGRISVQEPLGADTLIYVDVGGGTEVIAKASGRAPPPVGSEVGLTAAPDTIHVFDRESGRAFR